MILTPRLIRTVRLLAVVLALAVMAPAQANNQALIELFKLLRDKGSLSEAEYAMLVKTAQADAAPAVVAAGAAATSATPAALPAVVSTAPASGGATPPAAKSWTDTFTLKGDLRTRYDYIDQASPTSNDDRNRGRLRYRLGVIATPVEHVEAGAGLASGNGDPRSANQTFKDTFSSKQINLDYAYMQYSFGKGAAIAGKFQPKNYLWTPTDVMWDTDINPEGVSLRYADSDAVGKFFTQGGVWVLGENNDLKAPNSSFYDPYITYFQVGQNWKSGDVFATVAATAYAFVDIRKPKAADIVRVGAVRNTDSKFNSFNLAAELGTRVGPGTASLVGEYITNYETASAQDTAWSAGAKYVWDKWIFKYLYTQVDLNAVPDWLPDSDRFEGFTGIHGHEFEVQWEVISHVLLGLDFYHVRDEVNHVNQNRLQADIVVKF